jgi:hypothetical protein
MLRLSAVMIGIVAVLAPSILAWGEVQLSTIPGRDAVKITIYKGMDIALVEESRWITLRQGENRLQFGWADTRIDRSSIRLLPQEPDVSIQSAVFNAEEPNSLAWEVRAGKAGRKPLKISYFIGGMDWDVDYIVLSSQDEGKVSLRGYAEITNNSGEDFSGVSLKLVAGQINRIPRDRYGVQQVERADKARRKEAAKAMRASLRAPAPRAEVAAEGFGAMDALAVEKIKQAGQAKVFSEHYLLAIEDPVDLKNRWGERLLWSSVDEVPIEVVYVLDYSNRGPNVLKEYRFKNDGEHNLGQAPLPPGDVAVYRNEGDQLVPVGRTRIGFAPVGGEVKLHLGPDREIVAERKRMGFARINFRFDQNNWVAGFDTEEEYRIKLHNHKPVPVKVEVYERFKGEWEITSKSHDYERKDARTILFKLDLPANSEEVIKYTVIIKPEGGVRR